MKANRINGEAGFSLLEVMAAVVILAIAVGALLKLSSGGLRLAKGVEDKTELVAAAGGMLRSLWIEGINEDELVAEAGDIECRAEVFPFRKEEGSGKVMKIIVTAKNRTTGTEFRLTSLKGE